MWPHNLPIESVDICRASSLLRRYRNGAVARIPAVGKCKAGHGGVECRRVGSRRCPFSSSACSEMVSHATAIA